MLGDSRMISIPQVNDCLSRGWIVVVPNHRLCPQVNIRDGPLRDVRDCLEWVYADDGLDGFLHSSEEGKGYAVDREKVMAFGTSSGGMLACGLVGPFYLTSRYKKILTKTGIRRPTSTAGNPKLLRRSPLHPPMLGTTHPRNPIQTPTKSHILIP